MTNNLCGNDVMDEIWRNAVLPPASTIKLAIHNLDQVAIKIVLVVNDQGVLVGTISDGDIRRGLLRGLTMGNSIEDIVQRNPLVVPPEMGVEIVKQLMVANKVQQIPVVDDGRRVTGLHLWDEIATPQPLTNSMVIMAGGKGTRLLPHTENCPKPMLPVAGKPMLEHIIERAKLEGFCHFILAVHYLAHMIEDYFGDGARFSVRIDYLRELSPLGTAGALSLMEKRPTMPFVVTNGDVLTDVRYGEILEFHTRHHAVATMAVRAHEWQHPYGVVQTNGVDIVGFDEKPVMRSHINAGVYVLEPEILDHLVPHTACDMPLLFERLQTNMLRTVAYPMHEPWLDVGRPDDLAAANRN
jgi:dTDP-glucose pyrophosphorylase